ncbi:hypothetical protein BC629DRAFT_1521039 [Irpex lacteus]|nr:hypothetical protein BC629DRAFT_1521039 [Irpex lacteus]
MCGTINVLYPFHPLLELPNTTGLSLFNIITTAFVVAFVNIIGFVGACVSSTYEWGYYASCATTLFRIIRQLAQVP